MISHFHTSQGYMGDPGASGKDGETGKEVCMDLFCPGSTIDK